MIQEKPEERVRKAKKSVGQRKTGGRRGESTSQQRRETKVSYSNSSRLGSATTKGQRWGRVLKSKILDTSTQKRSCMISPWSIMFLEV